MKKNGVIVGWLFLIVCGLTACGSIMTVESVAAMEPEIIVIKDEVAVPMAQQAGEEHMLRAEKESIVEKIADGRVDESDFVADIRGTVVKLNEEINALMNTLGEPDSFIETVRNPKMGSDKEYVYHGIVIYTNPRNGRDIVNTIEYRGEEKTISGIGIGSTRADIEAAYGIEYVMDPEYITYTYRENATIRFRMQGEECIGIILSWK